jgi:hypothetical protein
MNGTLHRTGKIFIGLIVVDLTIASGRAWQIQGNNKKQKITKIRFRASLILFIPSLIYEEKTSHKKIKAGHIIWHAMIENYKKSITS